MIKILLIFGHIDIYIKGYIRVYIERFINMCDIKYIGDV